jgi:NADH-quinone oxidoreductase subunit H
MIEWLQSNTPPWLIITLIVHGAVLGTVAYLILLERKTASWVQDRIGPNRVGLLGLIPFLPEKWRHKPMLGLGQPLADGLKFIFKEDYRPGNVDRILFTIAPVIMIVVIIISIAVIPWGGIKQTTREIPAGQTVSDVVPPGTSIVASDAQTVTYQWSFTIADLNIGVLFILATLSLAVYGVVIGGWASNNKYSFLGGLRATANMISYEIPLGLSILVIVLMFGTLNLTEIVDKQAWYWGGIIPAWNVFTQPLAFLMFLVCIHAEANRAPFDTAEAEQELVGGYHTEYSSMRFALFFLAEYAGMITTSALCVALFFGGWHLPYIDSLWPALRGDVDPANPSVTTSLLAGIVRAMVFFGKTLFVVFIFMWVRWSLPRFRFDQIMNLAWRAMIPISLLILMATAVLIYWWGADGRAHMRIGGRMALAMLGMNVVLLGVIMLSSTLLPAPPDTNRRIRVTGSRYERTPVPASAGSVA